MKPFALRALVLPAVALFALGAAQGCSAGAADDGAGEVESDLDFYSASAREYFVSGTSTVTLEPELAQASDDVKMKRAKELVTLKNVAINWFLNTYLATKESEDANKSYGGFGALTKFASEEDATVTKTDDLTYSFTYKVEVAGKKQLVDALPGTADGHGGKRFTLQMGRVPNADLSRLDTNHEWYRDAPWSSFDPSTLRPDQLEKIDLAIVPQEGSKDAFLAYDKLFADGELSIAVHFGWDYWSRYDITSSRNLYNWLTRDEGFRSPVASYETYLRTSGPLTKTIQSNGKDIAVKLWIFHPGDASQGVPGPDPDTDEGGIVLEDDVRDSLAHREVIVWEGHSGPLYGFALADWKTTEEGDFDDTDVPGAEMPSTYQIVMANGCNTYDLGQAFWKNPAKADHQNINVITTTSFSNAGTDASAVRLITALTNQTNGKVVPSLVSQLAAGLDGDQGWGFDTMFGVHGIDANPKFDPFSDASKLCAACESDADCGADGNRCTLISADERVCTTGCVDDSGCQAGYACKGVRNATEKQCVPTSGVCRR
jgi:hypothetical protein